MSSRGGNGNLILNQIDSTRCSLHSRGGQLHDHNQEGYYVILCGSLAGRASVYSEQSINHKAASIFVIRYADHEMPTPRVITFIRRSVKQIHSIGFTAIRKIVGRGEGGGQEGDYF